MESGHCLPVEGVSGPGLGLSGTTQPGAAVLLLDPPHNPEAIKSGDRRTNRGGDLVTSQSQMRLRKIAQSNDVFLACGEAEASYLPKTLGSRGAVQTAAGNGGPIGRPSRSTPATTKTTDLTPAPAFGPKLHCFGSPVRAAFQAVRSWF